MAKFAKKIPAKNRPKPANSTKRPVYFLFAWWQHVYAETVYRWRHRASAFSARFQTVRNIEDPVTIVTLLLYITERLSDVNDSVKNVRHSSTFNHSLIIFL